MTESDDRTRIFADDDAEQLKRSYEEAVAGAGPEHDRYTRIFTDEEAEQLKRSLAASPRNDDRDSGTSAGSAGDGLSDAETELSIAEKVRRALNEESGASSPGEDAGPVTELSTTAEIRAAINADMAELAKEIGAESSVVVPSFDDEELLADAGTQSAPDTGEAMKTQGNRTGSSNSGRTGSGTGKTVAVSAGNRSSAGASGKGGTHTAASARTSGNSGTKSTAAGKNGTGSARTAVGAPRKGEGTTSEKRKRRKKSKYVTRTTGQKVRTVVISVLIWAIVIVACYGGYKFGYAIFYDVAVDESDISQVSITITGEETDEEIGEILLELDMIEDVDIFLIRCKLYNAEYIAGTYTLSRSYNTEKILNILAGYDYSEGQLTE